MSIVRQDTFSRSNVSSGWGTATDGNAWTIQSGDAQSVTSNEGAIGPSSTSTFATLGATLSGADAEGLVRFQTGDPSNDTAGILLRWTDSSNHWLCRYNGAASQVVAMVKSSGTYTTLSPAYSLTTGATSWYWLRFRCQGTTISFKVWQDGTSEPSSWTEQYTSQTSQNVAGKVGLYGYGLSTNDDLFDHFSVDDLAGTTPISVSDSASGTESESFATIAVAVSDSASGTDAASLPALTTAVPVSDSATGADVYAQTGIIQSDTAAGSEPPITVGTITPAISDTASGTNAVGFALAGTGIGDLTVSTKNQTWTGGPSGSPGVETDVTYKDATGSGWSVGFLDSYGGMPIQSWYEVDANSVGINQTSLATSVPDGHIHWLEQSSGGTFAGSEDGPFTRVELAPAGTGYRRYYKTTFGPDANGFNWTAYACVYPGDPGLIFYRFDCTNPGGSAIALSSSGDAMEVALIGGMQASDSTWAATNGYYGTLGGTNTAWPTASPTGNLVSADPDYVYITPASGSGVSIGQLTVKQKASTSYSPAWSNPQLAVLRDAGNVRMKIKLQSDSPTSFPASTTSTIYLLNVLRRSLTSTDAIAIAADYINPGTPTAATGSFTSFSYDEGAFVFAASGNLLNATLDLSPSHVTVRYKPRYKVTGWTSTAAPNVTWGGGALTAGSDYRYLIDTTNNILYLQMYFDVVASGASVGQKNNAALNVAPSNVTPAVTDSATGSEGVALGTVAPALVDSAVGAETATLATITPAVSDSALGSESLDSLGLALPADSATGAESVALTAATPAVSDSATGDDSQLTLGTIAPSVSDTALGDDSGVSVGGTIALTAPDSAVGAETATLGTVAPSVSDSAAGAQAVTPLSVTAPLSDTAAGSETTALTEQIAASDTAVGSESATLSTVPISASDSGAESEQLAFGTIAVTPPSDTAAGSEQVSQATALTAPDSAAGSEQLALGPITPLVSDGAVGSEQEALGTVSVAPPSDTAAGTETPSVNVSLVQPAVPDSATGSDSAALGVIAVSASDSALGLETPILGTISPSVPDSGLGNDSAVSLGTISPTSSDTALGAETLAPPSVSAPQLDTATGAEQLAFGAVAPSVSDTALGSDVVGLGSAAPSISDTALGSEAVSQGATVAPSVSDSGLGSGAETLGATVTASVGDSAGGSETLGFSASTIASSVADSATGSESGPTLAPITPSAADSALGVEGPLTFGTITPTLPSDLASGTESPPALLIEPSVPDSALGSESVNNASATLAPSDTALGSETLGGAQVTLAPSDSAVGSESAPQIAATLPLSPDTATGSESGPSLLIAPHLSESATGAEALAETTTLGLAESATGAESVTQSTSAPSISDSGAGAEGIALFEAGPPLADSATGAETVASISLTLQPIGLTDQAVGSDVAAIEAPLALEGVAVTLYARDATARITTVSASAPLTTRDATATLTGV